MERDKLKQTTAGGGGGRRRGGAAVAQETRVSDALGAQETVVLQGREFILKPLTFGDLRTIEERYETTQAFFEQVSQMKIAALGFLFWLFLRKSEPGLTEEALDELLPVREGDLLDLLHQAMTVSGLVSKNESGGETAAP